MLEPDGVIALVNQVASESHKNVTERESVCIYTNQLSTLDLTAMMK